MRHSGTAKLTIQLCSHHQGVPDMHPAPLLGACPVEARHASGRALRSTLQVILPAQRTQCRTMGDTLSLPRLTPDIAPTGREVPHDSPLLEVLANKQSQASQPGAFLPQAFPCKPLLTCCFLTSLPHPARVAASTKPDGALPDMWQPSLAPAASAPVLCSAGCATSPTA